MSYDADAFLRHQVERGMTFAALCRTYGASPNEMRQTLGRVGLLQSIVPPATPKLGQPSGSDPDAIPAALAARLKPLQQALYRELRRVATEGGLCPSVVELATALNAAESNIQKGFPALVRHGAIRVRVIGQRRVVEVLETGQSTAEPVVGSRGVAQARAAQAVAA